MCGIIIETGLPQPRGLRRLEHSGRHAGLHAERLDALTMATTASMSRSLGARHAAP